MILYVYAYQCHNNKEKIRDTNGVFTKELGVTQAPSQGKCFDYFLPGTASTRLVRR